ncbi:tctex1 domain-containing 2 [Brachionus plicatilis]|uniref:Tctex1 domain-containing 2 n=1 Tax=Brachionus plicatilis TaxID=10195 RepID=A0A3M7PX19_BRAPC|nr:tctex1 domain-containing 2 [Brachionus plicatilis]
MLFNEEFVSLVHESEVNPDQSSSSDEDSNLEVSNELADLIDADLSSDPEKESRISLCESDKKKLSSIYPSQIICNEKFNSIFNIAKIRRTTSREDQTPIDFPLTVCEDNEKKMERKKRLEKKLFKESLRYDSAYKMMIKKKFLESKKEPKTPSEQEQTKDRYIANGISLDDEKNHSIATSLQVQCSSNDQEDQQEAASKQSLDSPSQKCPSPGQIKDFKLSPKNKTYILTQKLENLITDTEQKLNFSRGNKKNSLESNTDQNVPVESKVKTSETEEINLMVGPECVQNKESNLLMRRKLPQLNLKNLPIDDSEKMPDYLKQESPNKRFATDESKPETVMDKCARELSISKDKPLVVKSASGKLSGPRFSFENESHRIPKTAPANLLAFRELDQNELVRNKTNNDQKEEILIQSINSSLFEDSARQISPKEYLIEKNLNRIKNIVFKNLTQLECLANPFDDKELANKTMKICKLIHNGIKFLNMDKNKIVVSVVTGHVTDEPLKIGTKCFWNDEVDQRTSYVFINDLFYCIVNAFSVSY